MVDQHGSTSDGLLDLALLFYHGSNRSKLSGLILDPSVLFIGPVQLATGDQHRQLRRRERVESWQGILCRFTLLCQFRRAHRPPGGRWRTARQVVHGVQRQ